MGLVMTLSIAINAARNDNNNHDMTSQLETNGWTPLMIAIGRSSQEAEYVNVIVA